MWQSLIEFRAVTIEVGVRNKEPQQNIMTFPQCTRGLNNLVREGTNNTLNFQWK